MTQNNTATTAQATANEIYNYLRTGGSIIYSLSKTNVSAFEIHSKGSAKVMPISPDAFHEFTSKTNPYNIRCIQDTPFVKKYILADTISHLMAPRVMYSIMEVGMSYYDNTEFVLLCDGCVKYDPLTWKPIMFCGTDDAAAYVRREFCQQVYVSLPLNPYTKRLEDAKAYLNKKFSALPNSAQHEADEINRKAARIKGMLGICDSVIAAEYFNVSLEDFELLEELYADFRMVEVPCAELRDILPAIAKTEVDTNTINLLNYVIDTSKTCEYMLLPSHEYVLITQLVRIFNRVGR